jgi:hypothetical protein
MPTGPARCCLDQEIFPPGHHEVFLVENSFQAGRAHSSQEAQFRRHLWLDILVFSFSENRAEINQASDIHQM